MKKFVHAVYAAFAAVFIFFYLNYSDYLRSVSFELFQRLAPSDMSMEKTVFISDTLTLKDYNSLFDKLSGLENSVALFLPQIFNIKVGDYLESIDPDEIDALKEDYKVFKIKLAEAKNVIPVVFPLRLKEAAQVDPSPFGYFKYAGSGFRLPLNNYVKVNSRNLWMSVSNVGFFNEYDYYPYTIPVYYRYNESVLVNAAVEAIRGYYKLPRSAVKLEKGILKVGKLVSVEASASGNILVPRPAKQPKVLTLAAALAMSRQALDDKIIIVKSQNNTDYTMMSLGITVASLLNGAYIKYSKLIDLVSAAALAAVLAGIFLKVSTGTGLVVFILSLAACGAAEIAFLRGGRYIDITLIVAAALFTFISVYYYRILLAAMDVRRRRAIFAPVMHPKALNRFIMNNRDIQLKNSWIKSYALYFTFPHNISENADSLKKAFEKVRSIIYNNFREFLIKTHGNNGVAVIIIKEKAGLRGIVDSLLAAREELRETSFNVFINDTEIYIYVFNGEVNFSDKNYAFKAKAEAIENKKNIIIAERDVQQYIGFVKVQKIGSIDGENFFNVAGIREEAKE